MIADLRLDEQLCFALYRASRATSGAYREALGETGLTYPQYLVMLALWETDGLTVGELGHRLHLDSGTLSPLLTRLDAAGLVTRSRPDRDARRVVVRLPAGGPGRRSGAGGVRCAPLGRGAMTPEELGLLRSLANRLTDSIEGTRPSAPANTQETP